MDIFDSSLDVGVKTYSTKEVFFFKFLKHFTTIQLRAFQYLGMV